MYPWQSLISSVVSKIDIYIYKYICRFGYVNFHMCFFYLVPTGYMNHEDFFFSTLITKYKNMIWCSHSLRKSQVRWDALEITSMDNNCVLMDYLYIRTKWWKNKIAIVTHTHTHSSYYHFFFLTFVVYNNDLFLHVRKRKNSLLDQDIMFTFNPLHLYIVLCNNTSCGYLHILTTTHIRQPAI